MISPFASKEAKEDYRKDRAAEREAQTQQLIALRRVDAEIRRDDALADVELLRKTREANREAWRIRAATASGHAVHALFVPTVLTTMILSWASMAAFGIWLYGPIGMILPLFTESAAWVFAIAVVLRRVKEPDRPVWHLQLGVLIFIVAMGAMNFGHGLAAGRHPGLITAMMYAAISMSGPVIFELVTAGPRRTAAERTEAAVERAAERRVRAMRLAAVRSAPGWLDGDGGVQLVYRPGLVTMSGRGLTRLDDEDPGLYPGVPADVKAAAGAGSAAEPASAPGPAPDDAPGGAPESAPEDTSPGAPGSAPAAAPEPAPADAPAPSRPRTRKRTPAKKAPKRRKPPEVHFSDLVAKGQWPPQSLIRDEMGVGQPRAKEIQGELRARALAAANGHEVRGGQ